MLRDKLNTFKYISTSFNMFQHGVGTLLGFNLVGVSSEMARPGSTPTDLTAPRKKNYLHS